MVLGLLPLIFLTLLSLSRARRPNSPLRQSFIESLVIFFVTAFVLTEFWSFFGVLNRTAMIFSWTTLIAIVVFREARLVRDDLAGIYERVRQVVGQTAPVIVVPTVIVFAVTFLLAIASPPNTYDSMTYHLARVMHWIQNGTVAFYPTAIIRQIYQPPLAEYVILNFQILSGADYFANLVQWLAMIGLGATASLITRDFGGNGRAQAFAWWFVISLPSVIVQASGTQNDIIAAFLVGTFFFYMRRAVRQASTDSLVFCGLALGCALLVKGTSYLFCFPAGLILTIMMWRRPDNRILPLVRAVGLILIIAFAINLPHYGRNFSLFGAPVSSADDKVANERWSAPIFAANVARNLTLNLATGIPAIDQRTLAFMQRVFGAELTNKQSTWLELPFEIQYSTQEDSAVNLVQTLALIAGIALTPWFYRRRELWLPVFCVVAGFALFSFLLKWQLWGSRLLLPLYVVGAPLVAIPLGDADRRLHYIAVLVIFFASIPFMIFSSPRALLGSDGRLAFLAPRRTQLYRNLPDLEPYYAEAAAVVRSTGAQDVGLSLEYNDFEYPLWLLLKDDPASAPRIRHVGVANKSARLADLAETPEIIITSRADRRFGGELYEPIWEKQPFAVLRRKLRRQ